MKTPIRILLPALLLLIALPVVARDDDDASETATPLPLEEFNGTWVLNPEQSQDLAALMREAMGSSRGPSGGRPGGGRGGGMRGGGMGGGGMGGGGRSGGAPGAQFGESGSAQGQDPMAQHLLRMQKEYSRVEIFLEGPELNVTNGLDIVQLYFLDGRQTSIWTERGEMTAQSEARDGQLLIRTRGRGPADGRTLTYSLSGDAPQLILMEERLLPGKEKPLTIRMVYDRTPDGADG